MKINSMLVGNVSFPDSTDININMMPFILGDYQSLPPWLRHYSPLIDSCGVEQNGKVCYLTITESTVKSDTSQRRGGIHTESPGRLKFLGDAVAAWGWGGGKTEEDEPSPKKNPDPGQKPKPENKPCPNKTRGYNVKRFGGIYMASTISNSCQVWNEHIEEPGYMGDCEHLRTSLGNGILMQKNQLWWMTDRCPHESLVIKAGTHRQFFRLVTNQVSVWFSKHNTPNPLGILPDCKIVDFDKFSITK